MAKVTKGEVILNSIWRFSERILAQLITTVVSVVLARILAPEDYGAVALIMIFINFCNILVAKGFNSALIQKENIADVDYSTAFYINLAVTGILYVALFFGAPLIADFYGIKELTNLLRVMAIRIPFTAMNSVQTAYVSRNMQFKRYFYATVGGTFVSGIIGIVMANMGAGAWALIGQYLSNTAINFIVAWMIIKWRPRLMFSFERAKFLFSYGWKILASSLLDELNIELTSLVIGKKYTSADLAFYTKGNQFPGIINTNVSDTITTIMFSVFSKEQSDKVLLRKHMRTCIKVIAFVMFPLLLGMVAVSEEFMLILLTEKWASAIPFMQIFCISCLFVPINSLNIQMVKALGESGKYLKTTFFKTIVAVLAIFIAIQFGVYYIAVAGIVNAVIATYLQAIPLKKLLGYSFFDELKDLLPTAVLASVMMLIVLSIGFLELPIWVSFFTKIIVGMVIYILLAKAFKFESYTYILDIALEKVGKKK